MDPFNVQPCRAYPKAGEVGPEQNPKSSKSGMLGRRKWPLERPDFGDSLGPAFASFRSSPTRLYSKGLLK